MAEQARKLPNDHLDDAIFTDGLELVNEFGLHVVQI